MNWPIYPLQPLTCTSCRLLEKWPCIGLVHWQALYFPSARSACQRSSSVVAWIAENSTAQYSKLFFAISFYFPSWNIYIYFFFKPTNYSSHFGKLKWQVLKLNKMNFSQFQCTLSQNRKKGKKGFIMHHQTSLFPRHRGHPSINLVSIPSKLLPTTKATTTV